MKTCTCGKVFDERTSHYHAFNLQKGYEEMFFCSKDCLKNWLWGKLAGMIITMLIGLVICIALLDQGEAAMAFGFLFLPYTIRQLGNMLGGAGEFWSILLVLVSTITVVYPAYKFVQELLEYSRIKKKYHI